MNAYDFDYTIYDGDSTKDFFRFCLKNRWLLVIYLPYQAWAFLLYGAGLIDKTGLKERFYIFLRGIPDISDFVYAFWRQNIHKVKHFYKMWQRPDDLIVSASPAFLLSEACRRLGVANLIASRVDPATGLYEGENCFGAEKVRRFYEAYPEGQIEAFFSDSDTDGPFAAIANKSYLVAGEQILPWGSVLPKPERGAAGGAAQWFREHFLTSQFAVFFIIGLINAFNGVVFSLAFSLLLPVNPAHAAGYMASLTISYYLNSRFTFKQGLAVGRFLRFCLSYVPNFLIQNFTVFVVYYLAAQSRLLAFCLAAAIGMPITFLILKLKTFGGHKSR